MSKVMRGDRISAGSESLPRGRNLLHAGGGTLALGSAGTAILFFLLGVWLLPVAHDTENAAFVIEVVRQYSWEGSSNQRWAYLATLILIAAFCGAATLLAARHAIKRFNRVPSPKLGMTAAVLVSYVVVAFYYAVLPHDLIRLTALIVAGYAATVIFANRIARRPVSMAILLATAAYLAVLVVPGFFARPIPSLVSDPDSLIQFESHLTFMTLPGSAMAAGENLFSDIHSYGLFWPAIMSVADHAFGRLTMGDQLRFVQVAQALFCLCAVCAYLVYRPRSYAAVLVALLFAAPFWTTGGLGIWHPNQTGYRSLGLPLSFLVLALIDRVEPRIAAWWLGIVAAVATLINFETAVAISIGYLVYLGLRTRSVPIVPALHMAAAGTAVFAVFLFAWYLALGRLPISFSHFNPFFLLGRFTTGGFGLRLFEAGSWGENYFLVPIALLMVGHSTLLLLRAFFRSGLSLVGHREAFRAAVAATLLVWLSYYFNAPNWWQIWTLLFLYGFLLLDLVDLRLIGIGVATIRRLAPMERWANARIEIGRLAILLLLALAIPFNNSLLIQQTRDFLRPPWLRAHQDATVVSDILMPKDVGDALQRKARELNEQNDYVNGNLLYLTYETESMPVLTGLFEPEPLGFLWGADGEAGFQAAMARVVARKFDTVLIDAPSGPLAATGERAAYQNRWRAIVARGYNKVATEGGWEIWKPLN